MELGSVKYIGQLHTTPLFSQRVEWRVEEWSLCTEVDFSGRVGKKGGQSPASGLPLPLMLGGKDFFCLLLKRAFK